MSQLERRSKTASCENTLSRGAAIALLMILLAHSAGAADASTIAKAAADAEDDAFWIARTAWWDVRSVATLPLRLGRLGELTWEDALDVGIAVGAIGVTIALDEDIRRNAKGIGQSTGRNIQDIATTVSWTSLGVLYASGVFVDDADRRHDAITGGESAVVSMGLTKMAKAAFGRQRPDTNEGAYRWFDGGTSFVSDAVTPHFAIAGAVTESFDHCWWAMLPSYTIATAVGVGRMGQDRHWASDVVGSAVLGLGTEKLFSSFHEDARRAEMQGSSMSIAPGDGGIRVSLRVPF